MATVSTENLLLTLQVDANQALASLKKVDVQTKQTQQTFTNIGKTNKNFGASFQNAGYQIQDFAVQVSSGTDAVRAFSQQAPQLLSAFGGIGIAAGTAVAVLAPLAKSLFDSGDAAEKAAQQTDKMAESIKGLVSPTTGLDNLNKLLEESESRFSGLAGAIRDATLAKAKNQLADLEQELSDLIGTLSQVGEGNTVARYLALDAKGYSVAEAQYKALNEYISDLYDVSEETAGAIQNLARQFAVGSIDVEDFAEAVLALGVDPNTEGYDKLLSLLKKLSLEAARVKDLSKIDIELSVRGDSLQEAIDAWDEYMAGLERLAGGYLDGLDPLRAYYREVEKLQRLLDAGLITADQYARLIRNISVAQYEAMTPMQDYLDELEKYADTVKRAQDPTIEMVEKITLLKDAHDAGLLSVEQYNKEMANIAGIKKRTTALQDALDAFDREILGIGKGDEITTLLEDLQTEAGRWADQFADTLVSGLAEGKLAFKDFADYVLQQLARIAISKTLEPLFQGFGDFIGGLTGASAPVPAGLIATPVNDLPLSREASSAQQMIVGVPRMSAPSPSSSPVTVNVMNYGSDDVEVNERKTSRGIEVDVLIKNTVKQGLASGDFDKVMATSYGARRLAF